MELILVLIIGFLLFNYVLRAVYSFMRFCISILLLLILKFYFEVPFNVGILFLFCSKNMLLYLSKKIYSAKMNYKKYRGNTDCLELRKTVRLLFECNYIMFILNCYFAILHVVLHSSLIPSLLFVVKVILVLLITSVVKKIIDWVSEKYCRVLIN